MWFLIDDCWQPIPVAKPLGDGFVLRTVKHEFRLSGTPILAIARRKAPPDDWSDFDS